MKRYFIALAAAALVGSTVFASAAALTTTGGLAQTASVQAECDDDGVNVVHRWEPEDATPVSFGPNVNGVHANCDQTYVMVVAFDDADTELGRSFVGPGHGGGNLALPAWSSGDIDLASIEYVNVTIIS